MPVAAKHKKIDELMERASEALASTSYFEAERLSQRALMMARQADEFERMARIALPLLEARRQRTQLAFDAGVVAILDVPVLEDMPIEAGCYLVQPPQVGADARRLRLMALEREIPVAVLCREPLTTLRLCPVVTIGPCGSIRTKSAPPADPDHPDMAWFAQTMEDLGDAAVECIDGVMEPSRRVDALLERLDAIPEHEKLHQALQEACREAHEAQERSARTRPPARARRENDS